MNNPLTYVLDYRLGANGLQVVALGGNFVIREIPYTEMVEVVKGYQFWNEHWENRIDLWASSVSIRLNRPILPWFVVTPANPDLFIADLRRRIAG